jgi:hypothetical protein
MNYTQTLEPKREQVSRRKPPSRFAKFMVMTSVLAALGGTPVQAGINPIFYMRTWSHKQETVKTETTHLAPEEKEGMNTGMKVGFAIGIALVVLMLIKDIKNTRGRPCGPWGTDLIEWNKHLEQMRRKREGPETKGPEAST